jgi:two-component system phosphate regulon sensor histidine kinase PhoR
VAAVADLLAGSGTGMWLMAGAVVLGGGAGFARVRMLRERGYAGAGSGASEPFLPPLARELFERLPDPLMLMDRSGRVLFTNRAMRAVVGTDVTRKHVSAVLRTPSVLQAISQTADSGEPTSVEFMFPVPLERHFQAYVMRTGEAPTVTALLLHDLTAVKRAEQARTDFIANASHELRTPLAAVTGFIETLKGHAKDDAHAREKFLDIMSVETGRMRRLIDDLLSLTRIEQNEHVPPAGRVDIVAVVKDAAAALGPLAEADQVSIVIGKAQDIPTVIGERDELIQLFQNLIHNASKYGKPGGHIWIDFARMSGPAPGPGRRATGNMVTVSVRDDGEGIPREAVPRLTERFYRVDVKRSRERGGTGLGLAIVKHIVNRHQGRLQIDSEPGKGSTFKVSLPAVG